MDMIMSTMSYSTFRRRVRHNTEVLRTALAKGKPLITIVPDLYTWTTVPGELHSSVLIRNAHDMLPAAYLGLLPSIQANGIDAFKILSSGELLEYELKTAEIRSDQVWKGVRGGLYIGNHINKSLFKGVTSALNAKYNFHSEENLQSKRMRTVLMICDTSGNDGYFDAWEMAGDDVMDYINGRVGQVQIMLGGFMRLGKRANTVVSLKGFDAWKSEVEIKAPVRIIGAP
jgi:hypothetical protein